MESACLAARAEVKSDWSPMDPVMLPHAAVPPELTACVPMIRQLVVVVSYLSITVAPAVME